MLVCVAQHIQKFYWYLFWFSKMWTGDDTGPLPSAGFLFQCPKSQEAAGEDTFMKSTGSLHRVWGVLTSSVSQRTFGHPQ